MNAKEVTRDDVRESIEKRFEAINDAKTAIENAPTYDQVRQRVHDVVILCGISYRISQKKIADKVGISKSYLNTLLRNTKNGAYTDINLLLNISAACEQLINEKSK